MGISGNKDDHECQLVSDIKFNKINSIGFQIKKYRIVLKNVSSKCVFRQPEALAKLLSWAHCFANAADGDFLTSNTAVALIANSSSGGKGFGPKHGFAAHCVVKVRGLWQNNAFFAKLFQAG